MCILVSLSLFLNVSLIIMINLKFLLIRFIL